MTTPAVLFDNVSFTYPRGGVALERISLRVEPGEMLAIVGPNGGGKSTLLKILLGMLTGYDGRVEVFGQSPEAARRQGTIGWVPQRNEAEMSFPISARQAVAMAAERACSGWRTPTAEIRSRVEQSLARTGAAEYADAPVGSLSGGQWQRVMIARALAIAPRILALDEPLTGIDAAGQSRFGQMLRALHKDLGLTILLISHDLRAIAGAAANAGGAGTGGSGGADRVACLRRTLHFHAAPQGITPQVLASVFEHDLADVFGELHIDAHRAVECAHEHPVKLTTPRDA
jgi:zinc transport system ATP-binding protein